tara:strand:+ start:4966 stop:5514 length:549 start_codon:yes stop_codon:yes gene_type:complete
MIKKEITSIIQSRKSVYPNEFNGEIIRNEDIIQLLENANHAPSHKMTQPWRFKIFYQNSKKKLLKEIIKVNQFSEIKKNNLEKRFEKTSHIISICMKKNVEILPEWEEIAATAMAVQNIWISCVGSNIGGYWSTPSYTKKLRKFLALEKNEICLGFFYLGIHQSDKQKKRRDSVKNKIQWFN